MEGAHALGLSDTSMASPSRDVRLDDASMASPSRDMHLHQLLPRSVATVQHNDVPVCAKQASLVADYS